MINSKHIPWSYIKISQVMASVKSDLNLFEDGGLIDEDRILKVVAKCNEKLGERIYHSRTCKIVVKDHKAPIPDDLWKIENIFALTTIGSPVHSGLIPGARQVEFLSEEPEDKSRIITYDKIGCKDVCNECYWVASIPKKEVLVQYQTIQPLKLSPAVRNACANYCPSTNWNGQYEVDMNDREFSFSFKEGEIYLTYLGDMVDEEGNLVIPFHPRLNDYYEYAIKEKILEDIFLNSESDVQVKLQYVAQKRANAYYDAWEFVQSALVGQFTEIKKKWQQQYYNEWYSMFQ